MVLLFLILPQIRNAIMPSGLPSGGNQAQPASNPLDTIIPLLPGVHLILLPIMAFRKYKTGDVPVEDTASELDPDAKTVIFAVKLAFCDKLIKMTFGLILALISLVLKILKFAQIDLTSAWFPEPFWQFYNAKLQLRAYQIDGCKLRFEARQEDAYIKFQYEAIMNFYTLGLFKKCCGKKVNYNRWLDSKIKWRGAPPPGYNQQFRVFFTKLTCVQKIKVAVLELFLSPFYVVKSIPLIGPIIPVSIIGMYVDVFKYKETLKNYRFGGSTPSFSDEFTFMKYVKAYYFKACLGMCKMPLKKWVDSCIVMGKPVLEEGFDDDAPEDEPPVTPRGTATAPVAPAKKPSETEPAQSV